MARISLVADELQQAVRPDREIGVDRDPCLSAPEILGVARPRLVAHQLPQNRLVMRQPEALLRSAAHLC